MIKSSLDINVSLQDSIVSSKMEIEMRPLEFSAGIKIDTTVDFSYRLLGTHTVTDECCVKLFAVVHEC